ARERRFVIAVISGAYAKRTGTCKEEDFTTKDTEDTKEDRRQRRLNWFQPYLRSSFVSSVSFVVNPVSQLHFGQGLGLRLAGALGHGRGQGHVRLGDGRI